MAVNTAARGTSAGVDPSGPNKPTPRRYLAPLLLPAVILLALLSIYPFVWLIYMSFNAVGLAPGAPNEFVGFDNWSRMFSDSQYWESWGILAKYSVVSMVLEVGLGTLLAILLNRSKHEKLLITILLMPMMMAPVVAGLLWQYLYNGTFGWYFWILRSLGLLDEGTILGSSDIALWAIVAVDVWEWTPLVALIVLSGLKLVPQDQMEASWMDGAGPVRSFFQVALPAIKGSLMIAILLRFMDNIRIIDHFIALTGGGPANSTKILPLYLYEQSFSFFELGYGASIALTLLLVTILFGKLVVNRFEEREENPAKKDEELV
ncbi:sugar ABC transporter permease [Blastococcus sp. CT_GayMR19]|uniref:carbohydrate ABC transporter permease n=1 Tax=Blastococcus sp. CT_GayMR19 TaxID=2559608 RepID=UPI001073378A|nr:sugar ABC transporter permease [Blastococcus sp. CT_GayMR19]TFV71040.1 sugar ABC transporter permease [Blastococcus sp. CT_GayMR19]